MPLESPGMLILHKISSKVRDFYFYLSFIDMKIKNSDFSGFATSFGVGVVIAIVQGLNFEINWVRTSQNKNFKFNSGFTVSI